MVTVAERHSTNHRCVVNKCRALAGSPRETRQRSQSLGRSNASLRSASMTRPPYCTFCAISTYHNPQRGELHWSRASIQLVAHVLRCSPVRNHSVLRQVSPPRLLQSEWRAEQLQRQAASLAAAQRHILQEALHNAVTYPPSLPHVEQSRGAPPPIQIQNRSPGAISPFRTMRHSI